MDRFSIFDSNETRSYSIINYSTWLLLYTLSLFYDKFIVSVIVRDFYY